VVVLSPLARLHEAENSEMDEKAPETRFERFWQIGVSVYRRGKRESAGEFGLGSSKLI
jgi:hypothetical protein